MSALLPYVDQAAVTSGVPAPLLSQIAWDLELETPAAVNAKAQQLAASLKTHGNDFTTGVASFYKSNGLSGSAATQKAKDVLMAASLPAAGDDESGGGMFSGLGEAWSKSPIGAGWENYKKGLGMASDSVESSFGGYFKNGTIIVLGIAVLVLAILANDGARSALVTAVTRGKA